MPTLEELQRQYSKFICAAISAEYNSDWENPPEIRPIADDLIELIREYCEEIDEEQSSI